MKLYGEMALASTNEITKQNDEEDKPIYRKKQDCGLEQILKRLEPYQGSIIGIEVESI